MIKAYRNGKKEVLGRLRELNENPESAIDWDTAIKKIKRLAE